MVGNCPARYFRIFHAVYWASVLDGVLSIGSGRTAAIGHVDTPEIVVDYWDIVILFTQIVECLKWVGNRLLQRTI